MILIDAGAKLNYYCSDITCTYPVNGKFTDIQAEIYSIVLECNRNAIQNAKVGMNYQELHIQAEKFMLQKLIDIGLVNPGEEKTLEDLWALRIIYYFFPHGLGHYLGTYVHDLPGDPQFEDQRKKIPKQNIRIARRLEAGMVFTIEPGLYFISDLMEQARNDDAITQYFNWDKIDEYALDCPAVRVEDDILLTESGAENLTDFLPRTVEEIEAFMAGEGTA